MAKFYGALDNLRGAKIILVGDPEQLQAILAGAAFRAIMDTALLTATNLCQQLSLLQKIHSQEQSLLTQHGEILAAQAKEIENSLQFFKVDLNSSMKDATDKFFSRFQEHLDKTFDQLLDKTVANKIAPFLEQQSKIMNESKSIIAQFRKDRYGSFLVKFSAILILAATLVGSLVGALIGKEVLPNNIFSLSQSQVNLLNLGQKIQSTWSKLTIPEREHIKKIFTRENIVVSL